MGNIKIDKGYMKIADRVLDKVAPTVTQFQKDAKVAQELGLVEFDFVNGYQPTQLYIDTLDKLN